MRARASIWQGNFVLDEAAVEGCPVKVGRTGDVDGVPRDLQNLEPGQAQACTCERDHSSGGRKRADSARKNRPLSTIEQRAAAD